MYFKNTMLIVFLKTLAEPNKTQSQRLQPHR